MLPRHGAANLVLFRPRVPEIPPFPLSNRIVCQDHETLFHQAHVHELIGRIEPGLRSVAAGRNDPGKRLFTRSRHVKARSHPEVRTALEHDVLDAIAVPLVHSHDDRMEGRPFG